jgi:hypothetical protein
MSIHQILAKGFLLSFVPITIGWGAFSWFQRNEPGFLRAIAVFIITLAALLILYFVELNILGRISSTENPKPAEKQNWILFAGGILLNLYGTALFLFGIKANFFSPAEKPEILVWASMVSLLILVISLVVALSRRAKSVTSLN